MKTTSERDPDEKKNWTARFYSADSRIIDTVKYEQLTMKEAHDKADAHATDLGMRCDDYNLVET